MSSSDVHQGEMPRPDDSVDDAVLAGHVPTGADDLAPVAALVSGMRSRRDAEPVPPMGVELRAVIDELCGPARPEAAPPAAITPRRRGRRIRALVGGVVAALTVSGLGVAGALPAPVQRVVSDTAGHLGIVLPEPNAATTVPPQVPEAGVDGAAHRDADHAGRPSTATSTAISVGDEDGRPVTGSTSDTRGPNPDDVETGPDSSSETKGATRDGGNEGNVSPSDDAGRGDGRSDATTSTTTTDAPGTPSADRSDSGGGSSDRTSSGDGGGSSGASGRSSSDGGGDAVRDGGSAGGSGGGSD